MKTIIISNIETEEEDSKIIEHVKNKTYYCVKSETENKFRIMNGYGCSIKVLAELQRREIDNFVMILTNGLILKTRVVDFYEHGKKWLNGKEDWQLILPMEFWEKGEIKSAEIQAHL